MEAFMITRFIVGLLRVLPVVLGCGAACFGASSLAGAASSSGTLPGKLVGKPAVRAGAAPSATSTVRESGARTDFPMGDGGLPLDESDLAADGVKPRSANAAKLVAVSQNRWLEGKVFGLAAGLVNWPEAGAALDWSSGLVRDVFVDPRRPLPQPLPGSLGNSLGNVPSLSGGSEQPSRPSVEQARFAQMRFWESVADAFPKIVSVVRYDTVGYVSWSNGKQQFIGDSLTFDLSGGGGYAADKVRAGSVPRKVEFSLVDITDGYVVVSLTSVGDAFYVPSERAQWALPWAWFGYLSPRVAKFSRAPAPTLVELAALRSGKSTGLPILSAPLNTTPIVPATPLESSPVSGGLGRGSLLGAPALGLKPETGNTPLGKAAKSSNLLDDSLLLDLKAKPVSGDDGSADDVLPK